VMPDLKVRPTPDAGTEVPAYKVVPDLKVRPTPDAGTEVPAYKT
jgi:hypothetical protein